MAKLLSGKTRITLDNQYQGVTVYETGTVSVSSNDKGETYHIATGKALLSSASCAQVDFYSVDEKKLEPTATEKAEKAMVEAAQRVERSVLDAARTIQKAQTDAQAVIDTANHLFNQSILAYLHTGKGNMEATKALEKAGIWASDDRAAAVACFEMDKLYGVDTLETGV